MQDILTKKLVNQQLSSVEFVQDYLQLHFDDKTFIIYIWPTVTINKTEYVFGNHFYRDKLCSLISENVTSIKIVDKVTLSLFFSTGKSNISINLDSSNPEIVTEIALFHDESDDTWAIFE